MQDFRVPGMLHGRVVRPRPAIGAKLESVDEGSLKGIAGVVKVKRAKGQTSSRWSPPTNGMRSVGGCCAKGATWSKFGNAARSG